MHVPNRYRGTARRIIAVRLQVRPRNEFRVRRKRANVDSITEIISVQLRIEPRDSRITRPTPVVEIVAFVIVQTARCNRNGVSQHLKTRKSWPVRGYIRARGNRLYFFFYTVHYSLKLLIIS